MFSAASLERAGGLDFVAELGPDAAEELAVLRAGLDHLDHAWTAEDLLHVEHLFDAPRPRAHDQDAVGQHDCLVDRMGDVHDRLAQLVPDAQQLGLQNQLGLLVEGGERLVHEQHLGISGEGARDAAARLHAARKLVRERVFEPRQADLADEGLDDPIPLAAAEPLRLESKGDVVTHAQPRKDALLLEYHRVQRPRAAPVASYLNAAAGLLLETGQHAQQGGLAAARWADDAQEFASLNVEIDVDQRLDAATLDRKRLGQATQAHFRAAARCGPASSRIVRQRHRRAIPQSTIARAAGTRRWFRMFTSR